MSSCFRYTLACPSERNSFSAYYTTKWRAIAARRDKTTAIVLDVERVELTLPPAMRNVVVMHRLEHLYFVVIKKVRFLEERLERPIARPPQTRQMS